MHNVEIIKQKYEALNPFMDERMRRLWAAAEATSLRRGGIAAVARATGLSRLTIKAGMREEERTPAARTVVEQERIRRPGGGRKRVQATDPALLADLESLVEPLTRGDPQSPLRWTCKSTRKLAAELKALGHQVGARTVAHLLKSALHYSLQANRKVREGGTHPDRNSQFEHIFEQITAFQERGQPVVSVDAKKKELVGDFRNGGREWRPRGQPEAVRVYDFADQELGKAIPYGVYDLTANSGWVSVGVDHDTAEFAVETLRRWWLQMGQPRYPRAGELLVIADGGGSNGWRTRLWKVELQQLADELGLRISVCHLPPGTSKWNKIEHRMFAYITQNWRGTPLVSHEVIVNLISNTRTKKGLRIEAGLDRGEYARGRKISDEELAQVEIKREAFHGEWNYTILPRKSAN